MSVEMGPGAVLFNKLLTPHWVDAVGDELSVSINISHGGLALRGELTQNEAELMQHVLQDRKEREAGGEAVQPPAEKPAWSGLPGQHQPRFADRVLSRI